MPIRKLATVEEIRALMEHLIRTDEEHDGDCSGCGIPTPVELAMREFNLRV